MTMVRSKDTPFHGMFAHAVSLCLFRPLSGEHERVLAYLRTKPRNTGKSRSEVAAETSRAYFRRHERQVCPPPAQMMRSLVDLCNAFSALVNQKTDAPFFVAGWRSILRKQLKYVAAGFLSDNPDVHYYIALPCDPGQLQKFRCVRGSSPLEGYHTHLERRGKTMLHATASHKDQVFFAFDTRWSIKALREVGLDRTGVKHFDIAAIEGYDASKRSVITAGPFHSRGLQHYVPLVDRPSVLKYGVTSSVEAWSETCAHARVALNLPAQLVSLHKVPTSNDTGVLLEHCVANAGRINFTNLAQVANARGLLFSATSAETWLVGVQHREVAFLDLHSAKYGEFMRSLQDARAVPEAHRNARELDPNIATSAASNPIQLPAPAASVTGVGAVVARPPTTTVAATIAVSNVVADHGPTCTCETCVFGASDDDDEGPAAASGSPSDASVSTAGSMDASMHDLFGSDDSGSADDDLASDGATASVARRRSRPRVSDLPTPQRRKRQKQNRLSNMRYRCEECSAKPKGQYCDQHQLGSDSD